MQNFDYPSINVSKKTNEENMQSAKNWMIQMSDQMNFYITRLEARIEVLEAKIADMEESN